MSRANPNKHKQKEAVLLKGGSAQTFRGMLAYVQNHSPSIVVFENVDTMDDRGDATSNLDILLAEMSNRGYENQVIMSVVVVAAVVPVAAAVKAAGSALMEFGERSISSMFATVRAVMSSCVRTPCCATEIFLPSDHAFAVSDLEIRQKKQEKRRELQAKSGPTAQTWMDSHMSFARSLKFRWGEAVPRELKENEWYQTLTEREQDALRLAKIQSQSLLFRDVSQAVGRVNSPTLDSITGVHVLPTILPKMQLWYEKQSRIWLGCEAMICQGYPVLPLLATYEAVKRPQAWTATEVLMQELAGNAMALPVVLAILQSMFVSFSWAPAAAEATTAHTLRRAVSQEDVLQALSALAQVSDRADAPRARNAPTSLEERIRKRAKQRHEAKGR
ncbi:SSRP1 [Symbiodinium sp. CCMP2592]|nr:SSRP1 [Symbiodinium sp. CCMP2592]